MLLYLGGITLLICFRELTSDLLHAGHKTVNIFLRPIDELAVLHPPDGSSQSGRIGELCRVIEGVLVLSIERAVRPG